MRKSSIFLLCFLCSINLIFFLLAYADASNISKESSSYQNYIKGLLFDELGEYGQAKDAYQKAAKSDFGAWGIHYRLALDYVRLKDFKRAEEEFEFVSNLRPYDEKIRFLLALIYSYRSKYKEAIDEYNKLLAKPLLELDETDIRYSLAQLYFMKKELEKAETEYKTILEKDPNDSDAHFYLGYIYTETAQVDTAIKEFNRAIEINPENPLALNSLSYLYAELGKNLDEALVFVQKALEFEPSNGAYLDTLGWVYYKKGEINKAVRYLENASVLTEDAEIFEHLGDAYLEMGRSEEARKNWQKSLALDHQRKQVKEKIRKLKKNK